MASSVQNKTSSTVQQMELVFVLKGQLDLIYKQLNHFRGARKSVDRLNRSVRGLLTSSEIITDDSNKLKTEFIKFDRNYRFWRKRLRKLDRELSNVDLYDKIHDLYESLRLHDSNQQPRPKRVDDISANGRAQAADSDSDVCQEIFITENDIEVNLNTSELEALKHSSSAKTTTTTTPVSSLTKSTKNQTTQTKNSFVSRQTKTQSKTKKSDKTTKSKSPKLSKSSSSSATKAPKRKTAKVAQNQEATRESKKKAKTPNQQKPKVLLCEAEGCQYTTIRVWDMKKHLARHSNVRPFKCDKCDLAFKVKGQLKEHQNIHEGKRFKCTFEGCPANFSTQSRIRSHIKIFHTKEAPLLRCSWEGCDYSTNRSDYLKLHGTTHTGERPYKCIWPDCDQAFRSPSHLWRHKLTHQNGTQHRFKCDFEGCDYSTSRNDHLQNHLTVHSSERPFKCPDCDQSFKLTSSLTQHQKTHRNERRYRCDFEGCDFVANLIGTLHKHEESKHGKLKTRNMATKFDELRSQTIDGVGVGPIATNQENDSNKFSLQIL